MEENASSQQDINDSSEIDKLNTELKHVQSVSFILFSLTSINFILAYDTTVYK